MEQLTFYLTVAGDTALHYAVRLHREDLVKFCLANGAMSMAGR